jgi:hypothetical protein
MNSVTPTQSTSTAKSKIGNNAHALILPFKKATDYCGVRVTPGKPDNTPSPMHGGYSPLPEAELLNNEIEEEESNEHEHEQEKEQDNRNEKGKTNIKQKKNNDNESNNEDAVTTTSKTTTISTVHKPYMTWVQFTTWGMDNPPKLVSHFLDGTSENNNELHETLGFHRNKSRDPILLESD